jgi:PAS domain S-box-containing protein
MSNKNNVATELTDPALKICLESSPVGIIIFDCDFKVCYANQLAEQLFNRDAVKMIDPKCGDFIRCGHRHLDPKGCGKTTNCPVCPFFRAIKSISDSNNLKHTQEGEAYLERDAESPNIWVKFKGNHIVVDGQRAVIMAFDDITSHKRNKEQLQSTLAELAAIHKNAPLTMILLDSDRRVRKVDGCAVNFADRTAAEMIGLPCGEALRCLYHLDHTYGCGFGPVYGDCKIQATVLATFKEQTNQVPLEVFFPYNNNLKDDRCLLINCSYLQINGASHVLLCAQDITEQKQFEEHLKVYQKIVISIPDRIAFVDKNYRYKIVNESSDSISGVDSKNIVGLKIPDIFGEIFFNRTIKPYLDKCLRGETINYQEWFNFPDKGKKFLDVSYYPYTNSNGKITGLVSYIKDITKPKQAEAILRRSEERYQTIIDASPMAIFLIRNDRYHYANPAAHRMIGFPQNADISVLSIDQAIDPKHLSQIREQININTTDPGNPPMELTLIKSDGSSVVTESISIPIQLEDGPAILAMGIDITDRKKSADLLKARLRLSEASINLDLNALLTMALDEIEELTNSQIGFFHFYDEVQKSISLHAWSTATSETICKAGDTISHYNLKFAGIWADCIRERKAVIHNDYNILQNRQGMPIGHAAVVRELVVPVFRNKQIVAIFGVGNKAGKYNDKDIEMVANLANLIWDILLRKRAEAALNESEKKHRFLIENSHDIIYILSAEGIFTFVSPSWTNLLGHPISRIVNKSFKFVLHPDDYPTFMTWLGKVIKVGQRQEGVEYRVRHIDGSWRLHTANIVPLKNAKGLIIGVEGIARDITNHKRAEEALRMSEERFRRLFTQNSATMLMIDPDTGNIIEANEAAANFYGWSIKELRQMCIQEINTLPPATVKDFMNKARLSGSLAFEFRHRRADGSIRDVEVFSSRIEMEEKDFLYSIIHDITERKQIKEALQISLAEKEVLLREVHHRVKNNLAAIIGLFNLQLRAIDDPQVQTVLSELSSRVLSMSLVHEKLYRSNSLARIDFQDYLQSLISHLRTSFGSPGICCEIIAKGVEMPLDLAVPCGMIINELITNALKYAFSKEQSGRNDKDRILVTTTRDQDIFILSVADNGIGLPSGFDFNTIKTLGLVLVRMLGQHQLGGRYEIDQTSGTRFTLTFSRNGRKIHE